MFVCVARLTLQIPESGSLKAKRQILRRITDRVKARFNVAVAEVEDNDLWQKATVALAVVGNERRNVDEQMGKIIHFVEEMYVAPLLTRETEILAFGDQLFGSSGGASKDKDEDGEPLLPMDQGQRSLAEAEGMGDWERRHEARPELTPAGGTKPGGKKSKKLSLDEARAKARTLRNPRDWEKK